MTHTYYIADEKIETSYIVHIEILIDYLSGEKEKV